MQKLASWGIEKRGGGQVQSNASRELRSSWLIEAGRNLSLLTLIVVVQACGNPESGPSVPYDVQVTPNVMVPMRDGVRLATDIHRPAQDGRPIEGKWPVILYRVPYGTRHTESRQGQFFASQGYVFLAQDARGRYDSEGTYSPFSREDLGRDGYDAVVWAANQDWSNGKVGTWGGSYSGLTQTTLGATNPPGLAAQYIREIFANAYRSGFFQGGAMRLRRIPWVVNMAATSPEAVQDSVLRTALEAMRDNIELYIESFPIAFRPGASPLALVPNYEEFLAGGIENDRYGPYWKQFGLNLDEDWESYGDVPVLHLGTWYDIHSLGTPDLYLNLKRRKTSPQKLIMGPWLHGPFRMEESFAGNAEFGPDAAIDIMALNLRWYEQLLRGVDTGILEEPPIEIFVMGGGDGHRTPEGRIFHGGEWRFEQEWPLARTQYTSFYFHEDGTLSGKSPGASSPTVYTHDPRNPVPTVGGVDPFEPWTAGGGFDQRDRDGVPLRFRPDVVVFQTPPLEQDIEVTGPITAKLYASSSVVNTDFTVKLVHVYPPSLDWPEGFELNISDGIVRGSHRESATDPTPLEPGRVYELTIEVPHVSNLFKRGHRIRVDIASSNFPRFDVNLGTMDPSWKRRMYVTAENRIYHDPQHPSHIVLPVIPR